MCLESWESNGLTAKVIDTPYRFDKQTRSWCISLEPDLADEQHTEAFIEAIMPVVSQVKTLLLFTTKEALFAAHRAYREKMQSPCFCIKVVMLRRHRFSV